MPTFTALKDFDRYAFRPKLKRNTIDRAVHLNKAVMASAAAQFGGRVRFVSQHTMLGAMLDWLDGNGLYPSNWVRDNWDGVCGGLCIEWVFHHASGRDIIPQVSRMTKSFAQNGGVDDNNTFFRQVMHSQSHQTPLETYQRLSRHCFPTNVFESRYPFNSLDRVLCCGVWRRVKHSRYYLIKNSAHAMAAYVDENGWLDFYDPDVGTAMGLSSTRFLSLYLKKSLDSVITIKSPEKSPDWPKEFRKNMMYYFMEYQGWRPRAVRPVRRTVQRGQGYVTHPTG